MSIKERIEYYRQGAEKFDQMLEQYRKEKNRN
jgi:hypothetical protein